MPALVVPVILLAASCSGGDGDGGSTPTATDAASPGIGPAEFDVDRAMTHLRKLSVDIGIRSSGSDNERVAAGYIEGQLDSFGYDASVTPFTFPTYVDVRSELELTSPEARAIDTNAILPSADGDVSGELISAGMGRLQEFPSGVSGHIVLVQRGDITFTEKVVNAENAGASGVIIYNNEDGPLNTKVSQTAGIPVLAITQADGEALQALLDAGAVQVKMTLRSRTVETKSWNVVTRDPSGPCNIVVGGHYDSVPAGPGANDNGSGTATVLELARVLAAEGKTSGVCVVLFGSEERGLLGSAAYVDALSAGERTSIRAMLNFDMLAVGEGWPLVGSDDMLDIASKAAEGLGLAYSRAHELPANVGSDQLEFARAGISTLVFNCFCDSNWHTAADRIEAVQPERIRQAGELGLAVLARLES